MINLHRVRLRRAVAVACCLGAASAQVILRADEPPAEKPVRLVARSRHATSDGAGVQDVTRELAWQPGETAILICDMWDKHWCQSATGRCAKLAGKMAPLIDAARA